jgi:hypothetical protein
VVTLVAVTCDHDAIKKSYGKLFAAVDFNFANVLSSAILPEINPIITPYMI